MARLFLPLILATSAILAMNGARAEDDVIVNYRPIIGGYLDESYVFLLSMILRYISFIDNLDVFTHR